MPVDILVVFEDGSQTRESWNGLDRWYRIDVTSTQQAAYAVVDPDDKLPLDADRLNNSRLRTPGTRGIIRLAGRWGLWLQSAAPDAQRFLNAARLPVRERVRQPAAGL